MRWPFLRVPLDCAMHTLTLSISFVNGDGFEEQVDASILEKHDRLIAEGVRGKELIHALYTDDYGAPPRRLSIKGQAPDGQVVDINIYFG
jgi:hypothetical protein